jgi:Outer membrane protein beta-barrel domain
MATASSRWWGIAAGRAGWSAVTALLLLGALAASPARAAEPYVFSVGVLGGIGGPLDVDEADPGTSQRSLEVQLGLVTEPRTLLELRLGRLTFDDADRLGDVFSPQIEYATISGEYRFYKNWYDSGIFAGLGGYRLTGSSFSGRDSDETAVGVTAGVTGEFEITSHLSLLGEITGHYVDLDESNLFATAMAGVNLRF